MEKVFLEGGRAGLGLATGGGGDDSQQLQVGERGAGDVEALGVGADVGRNQEETDVVDEIVGEG